MVGVGDRPAGAWRSGAAQSRPATTVLPPACACAPSPADSRWKTGFRLETESCFSVGGSLTFGPSVLDKRPSDLLDFFFFKIVLEEMVEAY